jgi:hypothetical protein
MPAGSGLPELDGARPDCRSSPMDLRQIPSHRLRRADLLRE